MSSKMKRIWDVPVLVATAAGFLFLVAVFLLAKMPVVVASSDAISPAIEPPGAKSITQSAVAPLPKLESTAQANAASDLGAQSYEKQCAICHGEQREGILPGFPPLLGIHRQMKDEQIAEVVRKGKGRMPGFPTVQNEEMAALLQFLTTTTVPTQLASETDGKSAVLADAGGALYQQNCAFCHGRDTMGGETGPDLTQSKIVLADVNGDKISGVVREGRLEKKMPAFNFSSQELVSLATFIHAELLLADSHKGGRRCYASRSANRHG